LRTAGCREHTVGPGTDNGLCFGWVSAQRKSLDEVQFLQKYVPCRRRSTWSKISDAAY
jgi:uncharacterized protein YdeI (YjbR/CyaY-like superfamily)